MVRGLLILALVFLSGGSSDATDSLRGLESAGEDPGRHQTKGAVSDSAAIELARGRPWHASRLLRQARGGGKGADPEAVLALAGAEAGWGNWPEVARLLAGLMEDDLARTAEAWFLLARAGEEGMDWEAADSAYGRFLALSSGGESTRGVIARARRARVRAQAGDFRGALSDLQALLRADSLLWGWLGLNLASIAAEEGLHQETVSLLARVPSGPARDRGWDLEGRALLVSGDSTAAEAAYWTVIPSLESAPTRAAAWDQVASLRLSWGDSVGAKGAYHQVLQLVAGGSAAVRAGTRLVEMGFDSASAALRGAEALGAAGRYRQALEAYGAYLSLLGAPPSDEVNLARARAHSQVGEAGAAVSILEEMAGSEEPRVGAPALVLLARALGGAGRSGEARQAQDRLVERFPQTPEAVDVPFLRGDALQSAGDMVGALREYGRAAELAPSLRRAGEARMRMGQILLALGREEEAAAVFGGYLADFPNGRRWDEAAFWAGATLLSLGRGEEGRGFLQQVLEGLPLSYYAVQAADLLGEPYAPRIEPSKDTLSLPPLLLEGLRGVDELRAAGLDEAVSPEVARLAGLAAGSQESLLRLALELDVRGLTREGINLGWEIRRLGRPWDLDLVRAIYPFPYREQVLAEAREWDLDPFFMAGLIRQESAFWSRARSSADARGLMQVLPSTGRELARSFGPVGFQADDHLYGPEVNLHLGMAFFSDLRRRFGDNPVILLSGYNAGPSRAQRWRRAPEAEDPLRFAEWIPFSETRGYVKNGLLNRAVYEWLYDAGEEGGSPLSKGGSFLDSSSAGSSSSSESWRREP